MFAEPLLAGSAEDRMEGMRRDMENCRPRDYHHYSQHHDAAGSDHLRDKGYHYSDTDDREVGHAALCYLIKNDDLPTLLLLSPGQSTGCPKKHFNV